MGEAYPFLLRKKIGLAAQRYARKAASRRGWKSGSAIHAIYPDKGVGLKSNKKYHMYQEEGTSPRLMTELEGKLVPMGKGRVVRAIGVGQPGYVTLPGGVKVFREQKWRHPGIKPGHLMRDALQKAIDENQGEAKGFFARLFGGLKGRRGRKR